MTIKSIKKLKAKLTLHSQFIRKKLMSLFVQIYFPINVMFVKLLSNSLLIKNTFFIKMEAIVNQINPSMP